MTDNIDEPSIDEQPPKVKKKTGNKPKRLREATYYGIEVGRDKTVVDPDEVRRLASIGMKDADISEWFGIPDTTMKYNFRDELIKGRLELKCSLRQAQIKLALSGNAVMLIWLGKNILGQSDSGLSDQSKPILPWNNEPEVKADVEKPDEAQ